MVRFLLLIGQFISLFAGLLVLIFAALIGSPLAALESVLFFVPAVLFAGLDRIYLGNRRLFFLLIVVSFASIYSWRFVLRSVGVGLNVTPSLPLGLYQKSDSPSAPFMVFCLPTQGQTIVKTAGLSMPSGDCQTGMAPLIKRYFYASAAAPVTFGPDGFSRGGHLITNTRPRPRSHVGLPLAHYPFGTYASGLWVYSDHSDASFDSRYYGPIPIASVRYSAVNLLTF